MNYVAAGSAFGNQFVPGGAAGVPASARQGEWSCDICARTSMNYRFRRGGQAQQMTSEALQNAARPRFDVRTTAVCHGCFEGNSGTTPGIAREFRPGPSLGFSRALVAGVPAESQAKPHKNAGLFN